VLPEDPITGFPRISSIGDVLVPPRPIVTPSSAGLAVGSTTLVINGFNFDPTAAGNMVILSSGAGSVTAATATQLTVSLSQAPSLGALTAVVTSFGLSSGSPVQVANVVPAPTVSLSSASRAVNSPTTLVIAGTGFDSTAAGNQVVLSSGAFTVASATSTSLTLTFTQAPNLGSLTAVVTSFGGSSGAAVQVATVIAAPTVSQSLVSRAVNSPATLVIAGTGFDSTAAGNQVVLSSGAFTVASATSTSLTLTFTQAPNLGSLTAVVTSFGGSSGAAVQVATIVAAPTVTQVTSNLGADSASMIILGTGFNAATPGANLVSFNLGAAGTVQSATTTSLVVSFSSKPTSTQALSAVVTSFGGQSSGGTPVPVASVKLSSADWFGVSSNQDGSKLGAAAKSGGRIWLSADGGSVWTAQETGGAPTSGYYLASSSDGTKVAAVLSPGNIWLTSNAGTQNVATWTAQTGGAPSSANWASIASSSNGNKLAAVVKGGNIWLSANSGQSWTQQNSQAPTSAGYESIASSGDGTKRRPCTWGRSGSLPTLALRGTARGTRPATRGT
jgi:hypothetical protein